MRPLLLAVALLVQLGAGAPEAQARESVNVIVSVRLATGANLAVRAEVRIHSLAFSFQSRVMTDSNGQATFNDIKPGNYTVEVEAPGYEPLSEEVTVDPSNTEQRVYLLLKPIRPADAGTPPAVAKQAELPSRTRKEVEQVQKALLAKDFDQAERHVGIALKQAPYHPFVNYVAGLVYFRKLQLDKAQSYLEKATSLDPSHGPSFALLGMVLYRQKKYAGAIAALERALVLDPTPWETHWTIAHAYFEEKQYDKVPAHAQRAREISKGAAPDLSFVLGMSLAFLHENDRAIPELEGFLARGSNRPGAPEARQALDLMRQGVNVTSQGSENGSGAAAIPEAPVEPPKPQPLKETWAPPDVDESAPPVDPSVACSLPDVLKQTSERAAAVLSNLEKIGAKEIIELYDVDAQGNTRLRDSHTFDYVVGFREAKQQGYVFVEESRLGRVSSDPLVKLMYTQGISALVLVFHPYYIEDFAMTCEGLGQWQGEPAWVVSFRQRSDKVSRLHGYRIQDSLFMVDMKGRAWIGANSYQFLRIETDMVKPVPEIELLREHMAVEYKPVDFPKQKLRLWLPSAAQVHLHRRGRRQRLEHSFGDFQLFLVGVKQEISKPKEQQKQP